MTVRDLCFLSLAEQARLIRAGDVSPVEVVDAALEQTERLDPRLNAYITLLGGEARAAAREAEREIAGGRYRGPLHGIPIGLKDLFYTKGVRTTGASKILRDFVPEEDGTVVARLREAGAIITGKTNLHEFAYGPVSTNPHYGDVHNPWDLDRVSGGSSGGSAAAVATGMCAAAMGSDTGGSIRIPASLCGLTGIKPTYGRVSRYGVLPLVWSMDHAGPLCRTAEDAALVMAAIAGWDPKDPTTAREPVPDYASEISRDVSGLRVAILREYSTEEGIEPEVFAAYRRALEVLGDLGMRLEEVSIPESVSALAASTAVMSAEATAYHEKWLRTRPEDYGAEVRARLELGLLLAATDYVKGQRIRALLVERFREFFREYDALVCPTEPATAPRIDQEMVEVAGKREHRASLLVRYTRLYNLTGLPALSAPCGFDSAGLPIGLQIAAGPFAEGTALHIAHAYQQATDWHRRVPPVAR